MSGKAQYTSMNQDQEIVQSYLENENATVKLLSKRFHRKPATISKILKEHGITPQYNRTRMVDDATRQQVVSLHLSGKTMPDIATLLGISHGSVCNVIHEHGGRVKQYKKRREFQTEYSREELLDDLVSFNQETGLVPNHRQAIKDKRLPSPVTYFKYFPNMRWAEILQLAGLNTSQYHTAQDGYVYDSSFEVEIANLLLEQKIKYEPHKRVCSNRRWTCDFYLIDLDLWLELDGLEDRRRDKDKLEEKLFYYHNNNYKYVILKRKDDLLSVLGNVTQNI